MSPTENTESVQKLVLSQESQPGTHRSLSAIAREAVPKLYDIVKTESKPQVL